MCDVKGYSWGKNKISLGIGFERADLDFQLADELMNGAQLDVRLIPAKDVEDQEPMFDEKYTEDFSADCSKLSVSPTSISASLKIDKFAVKTDRLERFTYRKAKISMTRRGDASTEEGEGGEE